MATESFERIPDCLYESNWHELPFEMQKSLVIMFENSQKVLYYHGFGVAVLNLETFTKVRVLN